MMNRNPKLENTLPVVGELFEDIVRILPPHCFTLEKLPQPSGEIYVRLKPMSPNAAVIMARGGGDLRYDLTIGEGTVLEIYPGGKCYTDLDTAADEVRLICEAVFSGNFEETVFFVCGIPVKTVGRITLERRTITVKAIHEFFPLIPKRKRHIKYAPYFD